MWVSLRSDSMKNSYFKLFVCLVMILFLFEPSYAITNISTCGIYGGTDTYYILNQSINSSGNCLTIGNGGSGIANTIIDGNGYTINFSQSSSGSGIRLIYSPYYDNITIKNFNIIQGNLSISISSGIYL